MKKKYSNQITYSNTSSWVLVVSILISSCINQAPRNKRKQITNSQEAISSDESTTTNVDQVNTQSTSGTDSLYWFSDQKVIGALSLNQNTLNSVYLRGDYIQGLLEKSDNAQKQYCLVASFNEGNPTAKKQLRARAIPILFNNFSTQKAERLLRIEFPSKEDNQNTCYGTVPIYSKDGNSLGNESSPAYTPLEVCTNCSTIFNSTHIDLYLISSGIVSENKIPSQELNLINLSLKIDPQSTFTSSSSTCSQNECQAKGFDCCLEGQCVFDGGQKPNASSSDLTQALAEVEKNYLNFLNWPSVYYICPNVVHKTEEISPSTTDAEQEALARFEKDKEDYYCLLEGKEEYPDYSGKQLCPPSYNETSYLEILGSVWKKCGCEAADPPPTYPDDPRCPNFGLKAILDSSENISQIVCDIPLQETGPAPFQKLQVEVSSRSAPHRFFSNTGTGYDELSEVPQGETQEGDLFLYLDSGNKTFAQNGNFNMNSILGQMSLTLNQAVPAKAIDVEFDQTYIISAVAGSYTPCPDCVHDSWFDIFTAHPTSLSGHGLQAIGYTTSRDTYSNNVTNGNFEDTHFGRACWIPPTMIPLSHKKYTTTQNQRLARLKTQASYYINGYQRDWFGFNKGALIGSFDGVTWFAVGSGRRVISTSKKLFLAINAPLADLALPSTFTVNVIADLGGNIAPDFDYDPTLSLTDARQNKAATCQSYHICDTDSDCISQLGWEYSCIDTTQFRTNLPLFDIDANEIANSEKNNANFTKIIQGDLPPGTTKRCVYRGAGAPCKINYKSSVSNEKIEKSLRCAPNFYCAQTSGSSNFNNEIYRDLTPDQYFAFGQETNIPGRPLNYIGAGTFLDSEVQANIAKNMELMTSDTTNIGICRPGKSLSNDTALLQHQAPDLKKRTDYINQIASCDSQELDNARIRGCPVIETRENQSVPIGDINFDSPDSTEKNIQNSCGAESKYEVNLLNFKSTFDFIEGKSLTTKPNILTKIITQDACLRRAGSVCHTDLDCSPGKLHSEQTPLLGFASFGGTEAEKRFWEESLICGQKKSPPQLFSSEQYEYNLNENRCCREIGKDISMYTEDDPDNGINNDLLKTDRFPYSSSSGSSPYQGTKSEGRYSRYIVAQSFDYPATPVSEEPYPQAPKVSEKNNPKPFQWKSFNDTGKKTCCGGGWIRKFADGTHDWKNRKRLNLDFSSFSCLNYQSQLPFERPSNINSTSYIMDLDNICLSPGENGCIQVPILESQGFGLVSPQVHIPNSLGESLNTSPIEDPTTKVIQLKSAEVPYQPVAYKYSSPQVPMSDGIPKNFITSSDPTKDIATSFYLPIYIAIENILSVDIIYYVKDKDNKNKPKIVQTDYNISEINCPSLATLPNDNYRDFLLNATGDTPAYCLTKDAYNRDLFHALGADSSLVNAPEGYEYAGVVIHFTSLVQNAFTPGNNLYYLSKLARLELLGIPQIFYEPLYCNNDRNQLVQNIFSAGGQDRSSFENGSYSIRYDTTIADKELGQIYDSNFTTATDDNPNRNIVYKDKIILPEIFSNNEFSCCLQLGESTDNAQKCCSNHAVSTSNGNFSCVLPAGTDLHVYFNRFISGDGGENSQTTGIALNDSDFIPETGEPKYNDSVNEKILSLGTQFCENNSVRAGGAFGFYSAEPNTGSFIHDQDGIDESSTKYHSIVDSINDYDDTADTGAILFINGFRWNHHYYCE